MCDRNSLLITRRSLFGERSFAIQTPLLNTQPLTSGFPYTGETGGFRFRDSRKFCLTRCHIIGTIFVEAQVFHSCFPLVPCALPLSATLSAAQTAHFTIKVSLELHTMRPRSLNNVYHNCFSPKNDGYPGRTVLWADQATTEKKPKLGVKSL